MNFNFISQKSKLKRNYREDITELHLDSIWKFCSKCLWEEGGGDCTNQAHEHRDQIWKLKLETNHQEQTERKSEELKIKTWT